MSKYEQAYKYAEESGRVCPRFYSRGYSEGYYRAQYWPPPVLRYYGTAHHRYDYIDGYHAGAFDRDMQEAEHDVVIQTTEK